MASILSALVLIMIEQLVAFHALVIVVCACCSSCILGGGALGMLSIIYEKHDPLVGHQLVSLSIDIVIDHTPGNLASAKVVAFCLDQIFVGRAIFAGAGPPCHTWSVARCAGVGPRVVRSAERLWGLYALELREKQHFYFGNVLLQAALDMFLALFLTGVSAFIEHPAEPSWHAAAATLPSIWKFPEIHSIVASLRFIN